MDERAHSFRVVGASSEADTLAIVRSTRRLAGRRVSGLARIGTASVFAKVFLDPRHAEGDQRRESRGAALLATAGVPAPRFIDALTLEHGRRAVLFEFVEGPTLAEALNRRHPPTERRAAARRLVDVAATLHDAGLAHGDLHAGNLVAGEAVTWVLDAGEVTRRRFRWPGSRARALGVALARLHPREDEILSELPPVLHESLRRARDHERHCEAKRFLRKVLRPCRLCPEIVVGVLTTSDLAVDDAAAARRILELGADAGVDCVLGREAEFAWQRAHVLRRADRVGPTPLLLDRRELPFRAWFRPTPDAAAFTDETTH